MDFVGNLICDACDMAEERIFVDSYTGHQLCMPCLLRIGGALSLSPATDGDNLDELKKECP